MSMQCLFREVHYFYYSVKSHQNTRTFVSSNFIALFMVCICIQDHHKYKTLEAFLEITFTSLSCWKFELMKNVWYAILKVQ